MFHFGKKKKKKIQADVKINFKIKNIAFFKNYLQYLMIKIKSLMLCLKKNKNFSM